VHSNHELNVTHFRKRFTEVYGNQRDLWKRMITDVNFDIDCWPSEEVINAIMDTRY